jgi:hypothetical protein
VGSDGVGDFFDSNLKLLVSPNPPSENETKYSQTCSTYKVVFHWEIHKVDMGELER